MSDMESGSLPDHPLLALQQQAGNQAVQQLLRRHGIQPKLAISQPDDPEEREADRVADRIMRMHAGPPVSSPCSCSEGEEMCEECQQKQQAVISRSASNLLQRQPINPQPAPQTNQQTNPQSGAPLPPWSGNAVSSGIQQVEPPYCEASSNGFGGPGALNQPRRPGLFSSLCPQPCSRRPLPLRVQFHTDGLQIPRPGLKPGDVVSSVTASVKFTPSTGGGDRIVLQGQGDATYVSPGHPLQTAFSPLLSSYTPVGPGQLTVSLINNDRAGLARATYNDMIPVKDCPLPAARVEVGYLEVPDPDNAPLQYQVVGPNTPVTGRGVLVPAERDDKGYFYLYKGRRVDLPGDPIPHAPQTSSQTPPPQPAPVQSSQAKPPQPGSSQAQPPVERSADGSRSPIAELGGRADAALSMLSRDGGQSLDAEARAFFEPRFGRDLSDVRVHTSAEAAQSARSIEALAYTAGNHIVFGSQQYQPSTSHGKHLLAHELAHVVQQDLLVQEPERISYSGSRRGVAADRGVDRVSDGHSVAGRSVASVAGRIHRSVNVNPNDPGAALFLGALSRLTGKQATAPNGTLALGAAVPGARPSPTVGDYVQRAISAGRSYTLRSGTTTLGGAAVRGFAIDPPAPGGGVTITINSADIGQFTWTADELVSDAFVRAVSTNDRTTATFPGATGGATSPATNLDDLLAAVLPFTNPVLRRQALDLIKQRVPAVAADPILEVDVENSLQQATGVTLAEILRGLETNTPYRVSQTITGDRVDATYIDPRKAPGASDPQAVPRRTVTFLVGPGRATPAAAPVTGGTPCSPAVTAEINNQLTTSRQLVAHAIGLLNSQLNLNPQLIAHFGPGGPGNRIRIAANYRLILSELAFERHGWICNPRGSGAGCTDPGTTGRTSPSLPTVQLCIETSPPFIRLPSTVLHEIAHSSGIGSLPASTEIYDWKPGYPGSDPLHNADSYAKFAAAVASVNATPPVQLPGAPSGPGPTLP